MVREGVVKMKRIKEKITNIGKGMKYFLILILLFFVGWFMLWGLFHLLQQDAFIYYSTDEFEIMYVAANRVEAASNLESNSLSISGSLDDPFSLSLRINSTDPFNFIIDGVELENPNLSRIYFVTIEQTGQHRVIGQTTEVPRVLLGFRCGGLDTNPHFSVITFDSVVRQDNRLGASGVSIFTDQLSVSSRLGIFNIILNDHIVTIIGQDDEILLDSHSITSIEFSPNSPNKSIMITRSDDALLQAYATLTSIDISADRAEIIRSSGYLTLFHATTTTYTPIRQDLFFVAARPERRVEDERRIEDDFHQNLLFERIVDDRDPLRISARRGIEYDSMWELSIQGMISDTAISGFRVIPSFQNWLYNNFSIIALNILTAVLGGIFGLSGIFFKSSSSKQSSHQHCFHYKKNRSALPQRRRKRQ